MDGFRIRWPVEWALWLRGICCVIWINVCWDCNLGDPIREFLVLLGKCFPLLLTDLHLVQLMYDPVKEHPELEILDFMSFFLPGDE